MKKIISYVCALAVALGLTPAETQTESTTYASQTLTGQVVSIEDTSLTLTLGTLEVPTDQEDTGEKDQQPSEKPSEDSQSTSQPPERPDSDSQNGAQPPERPDGDSQNGAQPPERPDGDSQSSSQPPERPDGDSQNGAQPPERPDDDAQGGSQPPEKPEQTQSAFVAGDTTCTFSVDAEVVSTLESLEAGDVVQVETDADGTIISIRMQEQPLSGGAPDRGTAPSGAAGGFGGSGTVTQGSAANTIDTDCTRSGESYTSTGDDENALRIDGASVNLENIQVTKSAGASSNTEDGDFYGQNAALLATDGANVTIRNAVVSSSAQNGNGVFSYGQGTTVTISDSTVTTTADNSGGIQTTGGGTTNASNLTVETSGNSSAAIRSDRGGGTVTVDGGSYTSNGYNSPAVYSTADITVKNAALTANNSEALVIEGKNSITLSNCQVSGNMSDSKGSSSDENVHNVMIYQSMSGDADVGTSVFSMTGGTLTSHNGDVFYVTNTHCILNLTDVQLENLDTSGYLLLVSGNSASHGWGTAGSNGAQVEFTADSQTLEGDIAVDSISTLTMTLSGGSSFTGTVNILENAQNGTAVQDNADLTIEEGSTWTLTGNCTLTTLTNHGNIHFNGYTVTLADGTVLNG